ncbi:transketolase [Apiospora saccharicola]
MASDVQNAKKLPRKPTYSNLETGPYVLRTLLKDVPLSPDGGTDDDIKINCVEYLDGNLYIGTSASEVIHFVQIPPDPADKTTTSQFIPATRLQPTYTETPATASGSKPGVQQILLLPRVGKACILCNWTVTFYSLPELSPIFSKVRNCNWVGGVDLNEYGADADNIDARGVAILLSLNRKVQVVRIGEEPRVIKEIGFPGSTLSVRRDSIACVADSRNYALLEIDRQLKIPLMSISSLDESQPGNTIGQAQDISAVESGGGILRSTSSAQNRPQDQFPSRGGTPQPASFQFLQPGQASKPQQGFLKPHIVSPSAEEFLLVTGTGPLERGIGMFVNLDGDPTRPTIEPSLGDDEEGYVLASMGREFEDGPHNGLEIQRWDSDGSSSEPTKYWLEPPVPGTIADQGPQTLGIRSLLSTDKSHFPEVVDRLRQQKFTPFASGATDGSAMSIRSLDSRTALSMERVTKERELFDRDNDSPDESLPEGWENTRNAEEEEFARRLAGSTSRLAVWSEDHIWWAMRNPLILQWESQLEAAYNTNSDPVSKRLALYAVLNSFRGRDAKAVRLAKGELQALEEVLIDSLLDPRVVLSLIPGVRNEVIETRRGIWIFGGVKAAADQYIANFSFDKSRSGVSVLSPLVLQFLKRFLTAWRRKKGFGSVQDENEVFRTVDAALLAILLELDKSSPPGLPKGRTVRSELYELVDTGVDCFDRAETLIESYHRLFVLSRLYQSRKMAAEVLGTWRRAIEGEQDDGGELQDGEQRVREYLQKITSQALVQEYGIWLANRNPKLGVQVFAEDKGRAPKFQPNQVVDILRSEAPDAVKYYLEYLVFGQGHTVHVNELINYYLDVVITHLKSSAEACEVYVSTYAAYRALRPLKPTYRQFLADNAPPDDEVWQSRLRLLQLLGGTHDYDSAAIRARIADLSATAEDLLVPETIILDGRERKHEDALRLLIHHLGDYDTAVAYCIRGGSSIYSIYQAGPTAPGATSVPAESKAPKRRESAPPTQDQQARLFRALLSEFLVIEDISDRVEQTGLLLERFGGWYDIDEVLAMIPDTWSVDLVAGFLTRALRRMVVERNETTVARALSSSQLLRVQHDMVVKIDEKGPTFEAE